jgi:hypothetical protein
MLFVCLCSKKVTHVYRDANTVAHYLVKLVISLMLDYEWIEKCCSLIHNIVFAEQADYFD